MTPRQQRRLEQKLARKALKKEVAQCPTLPRPDSSARLPEPAPISEAKLAANRENAQLSTGATSDAGKAIVSQNATKHGLTGRFKVLACESQSEFDQLLNGFLRAEAPRGDDEIAMVHQMAESVWLSRRCLRLQNDCFHTLDCGTPEEQNQARKNLALYLRYQTTHDRTFSRYATELRKRRNERTRAERGFVSQKHKEAAENRRQELHAQRQTLLNLKQEAQELRNR
ncbi:MAG: hypothetical protein JO051_02165, partial [Acidobacteriaceae bacterium]|nr:hypothetical protein [Acidobacteriaceae bacterium]